MRPGNTSTLRTIRPATIDDLPTIMALIDSGRTIMRSNGNTEQWPEGTPSEALLRSDILSGHSYLLLDGSTPVATFAFIPGPDPTYNVIEGGAWLSDDPYCVIHRLSKRADAHGVFTFVLDWCFTRTSNIRIDTHSTNTPMQHCLLQYGFTRCGLIHILDGTPRIAFQKRV